MPFSNSTNRHDLTIFKIESLVCKNIGTLVVEGNIHHAKDAIELVTINIWKSLAKLQKHLNKANRKNRSDNVKLNQQL